MTCDSRKERLIDLLAGELSEMEAVVVEQHLAECKACRVEMNALALMSHPFLSEEPWQPDAAMADRILLRAQPVGWAAVPASRAQTATHSLFPARPSRSALRSWITRPLPSYAAVGLALLALVVGLLFGGGGSRLRGRGVPTEAGGSDRPPPSSPPAERSADRAPERLAERQPEGDSIIQTTAPARRGRASTEAHSKAKPIAFVAVYTDAMRLTTPGQRDSF